MGQGILFGVGFMLGIVLLIIAVISLFVIYSKIRRKRPTIRMWNEYKRKTIENEDYAEAEFVTKLIEGKDNHETTILPPGYTIEENSETIIGGEPDKGLSVRTNKQRWIVKLKPNKKNPL